MFIIGKNRLKIMSFPSIIKKNQSKKLQTENKEID